MIGCRYAGCEYDGEEYRFALDSGEGDVTWLCRGHREWVEWARLSPGCTVHLIWPEGLVMILEEPRRRDEDSRTPIGMECWFATCRKPASEYRSGVFGLPLPGHGGLRRATVRGRACNEHDRLLDEAKRRQIPVFMSAEGLLWIDTTDALLEGRSA